MLKLHTIIASTRPGRVGLPVGKWFHGLAEKQGLFDNELVDLVDFNLPVYDEPMHPVMQKYQHEHTKRWAASVTAADAYVFVMPEYNFGPTPALINALNYVYLEWNYKPAAFVSYGGVSGGLRSTQAIKPMLTTLKMMPIMEQVTVQMVNTHVKDGVFTPQKVHEDSGAAMLTELKRWAEALKPMRG